MHDQPENEPRSFRLSRGPSDLGTLLLVLAFGVVLIIAPLAARWLFRAIVLVFGLALFRYILLVRGIRDPVARPSGAKGHIGNAILIAVIALSVWVIARMIAAGNWIDAVLASLIVPQVLYLRWLRIRRDSARP